MLDQLGPIVRAAARRRLAISLVIIEVAIGSAIAVLVAHIGQVVLSFAAERSGFAETELAEIAVLDDAPTLQRFDAQLDTDRATIRTADGVSAATWVDTSPTTWFNQPPDVVGRTAAEPVAVPWMVSGGPELVTTLGAQLVAGRDFTATDVAAGTQVAAIVTRTIASQLFGTHDAVGQQFASRRFGTVRVVGVVEDLHLHLPGVSTKGNAVLYASRPVHANRVIYLLRGHPPTSLAAAAIRQLGATGRLAVDRDIAEVRAQNARANLRGFQIVIVTLAIILIVVLTGAAALTSYLVVERAREIGLRRALGATRTNILHYFVIESAMVTLTGLVIGLGLAGGLLAIFTQALPKLTIEPVYFVATAVAFLLLDHVATWLPARRAMRIAPGVASRVT